MRRIEAGIRRYWGDWAEPFLIVLRGTKDSQISCTAIPLSHPLPTLTAGGGHVALINPIAIDMSHPGDMKSAARCRGLGDPMGTITCRNNWAWAIPFVTRYNGGENRNHDVGAPLPVIDCGNRYSLIQPLVIPQQSAGTVKPVANPTPTIATAGAIGLVQPFLLKYYGSERGATAIGDPLATITTKDRFGLVEGRVLTLPDGQRFKLDITYRMLTMRELSDATGFPHEYSFAGTDTQAKKQIGNAVPPPLARALYLAALAA